MVINGTKRSPLLFGSIPHMEEGGSVTLQEIP